MGQLHSRHMNTAHVALRQNFSAHASENTLLWCKSVIVIFAVLQRKELLFFKSGIFICEQYKILLNFSNNASYSMGFLLQHCTAYHITSLEPKIKPSQKPKCPIILILRDSKVIPGKWFYLNLVISPYSQTEFGKVCMFG